MTPKALKEWLAVEKRRLVEESGCHICGKGRVTEGFERFWSDDQYNPRSYVLKDIDGVPINQYILRKATREELDAILPHGSVTCRKCNDPRRR